MQVPGAAVNQQVLEIDIGATRQRRDRSAGTATRACRRQHILKDERIVATRAAIDHAGRRKPKGHADQPNDIKIQADATGEIDRRTGDSGKRVGAIDAHRDAAIDSAGVGKAVARSCRSRCLEAHSTVDGTGIDEVHLAAAVRGDHRDIRGNQGHARNGRTTDRTIVADIADATRAVLDSQRHASKARKVDAQQSGRAVHHASGRIGDIDRAGGAVANHRAGGKQAQQAEQAGINRARVIERGVVAGQRHGRATDAQQHARAAAGLHIHGQVVGACRIAGCKGVGSPRAGDRGAGGRIGRRTSSIDSRTEPGHGQCQRHDQSPLWPGRQGATTQMRG